MISKKTVQKKSRFLFLLTLKMEVDKFYFML